MMKYALAAALATTLSLCAATRAADNAVKLMKEDNRVVVEVGGKPFTNYYYGPEGGRPYVRPFMYPVLAADGTGVTSDRIQVPKGDHPHHRSLWVAHGDVNGADHWLLSPDSPKQNHLGFQKVDGDTLVEDLEWETKDHKPMLKEKRTVRFAGFADGARGVEITSVFTPVAEAVTFRDTKEAGLCAARVADPIAKTSVITLSTGVVSTNTKEETKVWGQKADWCDLSGQIDGKTYGVAVLDHPENPKHPSNWHVRHYGLNAANIFGLSEYDRKNPKGSGNLTIDAGKSATFHYLAVIHAGDAKAAGLDAKYKEFAGK